MEKDHDLVRSQSSFLIKYDLRELSRLPVRPSTLDVRKDPKGPLGTRPKVRKKHRSGLVSKGPVKNRTTTGTEESGKRKGLNVGSRFVFFSSVPPVLVSPLFNYVLLVR